MLFHPCLAPGIIDLSPYWGPPLFAAAVIAVDAMVWECADHGVLGILHGHPDAPQHLIRAVIFRVVMDHLCNPQRHEPPPWWPSLLHVTTQLSRLAATTPEHGSTPPEVEPR